MALTTYTNLCQKAYKDYSFFYCMQFIEKDKIRLDKILNELDVYVLDFIKILEKHIKYVIVSGYVSILFGRSRGTEDIDIFIESTSKEKLKIFYRELEDSGYWCLNVDDINEIYEYLSNGTAVRFAKKGETIPNFEIKFALKGRDKETLQDVVIVSTKQGNLRISSLERQIAFKRYYLKSDKDMEDALHIEEIFKSNLDYDKIKKIGKMLENEKI